MACPSAPADPGGSGGLWEELGSRIPRGQLLQGLAPGSREPREHLRPGTSPGRAACSRRRAGVPVVTPGHGLSSAGCRQGLCPDRSGSRRATFTAGSITSAGWTVAQVSPGGRQLAPRDSGLGIRAIRTPKAPPGPSWCWWGQGGRLTGRHSLLCRSSSGPCRCPDGGAGLASAHVGTSGVSHRSLGPPTLLPLHQPVPTGTRGTGPRWLLYPSFPLRHVSSPTSRPEPGHPSVFSCGLWAGRSQHQPGENSKNAPFTARFPICSAAAESSGRHMYFPFPSLHRAVPPLPLPPSPVCW